MPGVGPNQEDQIESTRRGSLSFFGIAVDRKEPCDLGGTCDMHFLARFLCSPF